MNVYKLNIESAREWMTVTEGIAVSDEVDQQGEPEAEMTVGFARLEAGESLPISFPYDEVLIITAGTYVLDTDRGKIEARSGDVIYLPAGTSNDSRAEEYTEMAYVAAPPGVYAEHVAASA